jgi:hypothetical protein
MSITGYLAGASLHHCIPRPPECTLSRNLLQLESERLYLGILVGTGSQVTQEIPKGQRSADGNSNSVWCES